ncbi:unnamed protein product [Prunus armeniaca]|uniref:F-box associated domain-containing protein n=1 Tax=Prunus armeniaca TaxID=36596 RepID=A0A6J5UBV2_PRUAR|nr:unnamed protein product [Prunus armeniaca]
MPCLPAELLIDIVPQLSPKDLKLKRIHSSPSSIHCHEDSYGGFGYDSVNDDYKLGALHCLVHHETDDERMIILTLDLASEDISELPIPFHMFPDLISLKSRTSDLADLISLVVMGGYLCIYLVECRSKALIMREYGVAESWTKFYSFDKWVYDYKPLMLSSCGKMVLFEEDSSHLAWYDLQNGTRKPVRIYDMPESFDTITSVGSIHLLGS